MNAYEVQLMINDFAAMVNGPEASTVKMQFYEKTASETVDQVFPDEITSGRSSQELLSDDPIKCIIKYAAELKQHEFLFGFSNEFESILYFLPDVNFSSQVVGGTSRNVSGDFKFIDNAGCVWIPIDNPKVNSCKARLELIGNQKISTVVFCKSQA